MLFCIFLKQVDYLIGYKMCKVQSFQDYKLLCTSQKIFIAEEKLFTFSIIFTQVFCLLFMYLEFLKRRKVFMERNRVKAQSVLDTHHGRKVELTGSKLPTYKQVLQCFLANVEFKNNQNFPASNKCTYHDAARLVADHVFFILQKSQNSNHQMQNCSGQNIKFS